MSNKYERYIDNQEEGDAPLYQIYSKNEKDEVIIEDFYSDDDESAKKYLQELFENEGFNLRRVRIKAEYTNID